PCCTGPINTTDPPCRPLKSGNDGTHSICGTITQPRRKPRRFPARPTKTCSVSPPSIASFGLAKSKKKPPAAITVPDAHESRGAVAVTVVWMLLALSCLAAQLVALATWLVARAAGIPAGRPNALLLVPSTLMLVAVLTGVLLVVMTPLAYRVRKSRPPLAVTVAAIVIAVAPLVTVAVLAVIG